MTADERALLAAIHADPAADLPRLVYADFLDDLGHAHRASFIRLQCDWHRAMVDPAHAIYANHLYNRLHDEYPNGVPGPPDFGGAVGWGEYKRGLPTAATVLAHDLFESLVDVFLCAPLRCAEVHDNPGSHLGELPELPRDKTATLRELVILAPVRDPLLDQLRARYGDVLSVRWE